MSHPFGNNVGYWVKQIYKDFSHLYEQKLEVYGLTSAQVNVLELLWVHGDGVTQKDLHERLKIRPASLTNLLNALVAGNWIFRKSDSQDARTNRVFLTDKGKSQCKVCMDMITELEQVIRQGLSPEEISLLLVWMKKIHQNIARE
ncbi:MarR family winged helix-turn-helix transcriptional regulator [Paenibacillus glycanilyticus]|uniref:MarR family transcriptional regulator n=1 Tax=Paenibacillus glycanilyticus TaxID=126569 RepID=A0ABQ6GHK9_9BACL|nr:MarR family transcriptional regulator [Paenibacillus glycanilyticus]GLX69728.1 MarR family transcriptional regulator [Paenibacillus glycanilyticus]